MRTRIADLIRDAIEIIAACDDPDCEAWLNQAKPELAVMNAKAELRSALAAVEGPVQPKVKLPNEHGTQAQGHQGEQTHERQASALTHGGALTRKPPIRTAIRFLTPSLTT